MRGEAAKHVVVTEAAVRDAARRATRASAKLEERVVPADHVRSAAVQRYLDEVGASSPSRLHDRATW